MIDNDGVYTCDYCKGTEGDFLESTGNHEDCTEIERLRAELTDKDKQITDWRDTYDITMPCGHKNRYLLTNGRGEIVKDNNGDARCLMCEMEKLKGSA